MFSFFEETICQEEKLQLVRSATNSRVRDLNDMKLQTEKFIVSNHRDCHGALK